MVGQLRSFDTLDCRRKHDHERSDEGSQRVKTTLGSSTAKRRTERTKRRHVGSYETDDSIETYAQDETPEHISTRPSPKELHDEYEELHDESDTVANARKQFFFF